LTVTRLPDLRQRPATSETFLRLQHVALRSLWLRDDVHALFVESGLTDEIFTGADELRLFDVIVKLRTGKGRMPIQAELETALGAHRRTLDKIATAIDPNAIDAGLTDQLYEVSGEGATRLFELLRSEHERHLADEHIKRAKVALDEGERAEARKHIDTAEERLRSAEGAPRPPTCLLMHEAIGACDAGFSGIRHRTGFATLDEATSGGIPHGALVVLAAAPGAGKTSLATWWFDSMELAGCACTYLAIDEESRGILSRMAQRAGVPRQLFEGGGDIGHAARSRYAESVVGRSLAFVDPDSMPDNEVATVEHAARVTRWLAQQTRRPPVLIVDSLQTAPSEAAEDYETRRDRMDALVRELKSIAKSGVTVIAISEMSRSGYAARDPKANASALSASKESGAIEYAAKLLIGMRFVPGMPGVYELEVAKNRFGWNKPTFHIRFDDNQHVSEAGDIAEKQSAMEEERGDRVSRARAAREKRRDDALRDQIRQACIRNPCASKSAIHRGTGAKKGDVLRVVDDMLEQGELAVVDGFFRPAVPDEGDPSEASGS
jgi:KaiC/GvpD/RAD55 family RecA-like ATPase